jgi:hypothetical protein
MLWDIFQWSLRMCSLLSGAPCLGPGFGTVIGDWSNACPIYVEFDDGWGVAVISSAVYVLIPKEHPVRRSSRALSVTKEYNGWIQVDGRVNNGGRLLLLPCLS